MITVIILVLLSPLLLINIFFATEVGSGLRRLSGRSWQTPAGRTVVILPAHNEERVIGRTLTALKEAAGTDFDMLVVADNCSDGTATVARSFGVDVAERHDVARRGKGFALAFARERLSAAPPAAVIVLDADCRTDRDSLRALAGACQERQGPAQAVNLLEPAPDAGPLVQVSSFAFLIKNLFRQRGLQRLTGGVHLTGTGMCLPWPLFERADLATASIVEDVRLGIELARVGAHPRLIEEAVVWSPHADQAHTLGQRSRWEGGFLALARATAPSLILEGVRTLSPRALLSGLDLMVPPLALLALINMAALLLLSLLGVLAVVSWAPALAVAVTGLAMAAAVLLAWWKEGRAFLSPAALARLPLYVAWKVPMYLKLARSGAPRTWNRTERPD